MKKILLFALTFVLSCSPEKPKSISIVESKRNDSPGTAAKIGSEIISSQELEQGIEVDLFELEEKIYNLKRDRLKVLLIEKFMNKDPKKVGLTNDEYFEKFIAKDINPTKKQINDFINSRGITKQQLNENLLPRIETFLKEELKRKALDRWLEEKSARNKVEIFFNKPIRPVFDVKVGDAPFLGKKDAKVTLISYMDYQCPFSKKGSEILKELRDIYGDNIKIVHKDFPLPFHSRAKLMAQAGLCVNDQSTQSFWKFYFKLFENQEISSTDQLKEFSKKAGLDFDKFSKCLDSGKFNSKIEKEVDEAIKLGVKSTPTFYINGKIINGAHNIDTFKALIDQEMQPDKKNI